MFNIGAEKLVVILVIALVVLGPERLPEAIRKVGQVMGELRKLATGFQDELREAMNEPLEQMRSTVDMVRNPFDDSAASSQPASAPVAEPAPSPPAAEGASPAPADESATPAAEGASPAPPADESASPPPHSAEPRPGSSPLSS